MKNLKKPYLIGSKIMKLVLASLLIGGGAFASAQTIDDYSALPENLAGDITSPPNVLIIVDNSGSMGRFNPGGGPGNYVTDPETQMQYLENRTHWDPSSSFSNSYQVRKAMTGVLNNEIYRSRLNVGLMTFAQHECKYDPTENEPGDFENGRDMLYRCESPDGTQIGGNGTPSRTGFRRGTNGLGSLRANFGNLDGAHKAKLLKLLDVEPSPYDSTNIASFNGNKYIIRPAGVTDSSPINGNKHPFLDPNDRIIDGNEDVITSIPDQSYSNFTPLAGSLDSAFRYIFEDDDAVDLLSGLDTKFKNGLIDREYRLGTTIDPATNIESANIPTYLSDSECQGPLTVILLTDGDASQIAPDPLTDATGGGGFNSTTRNAAAAAALRIRYRGHANEAAARRAGITAEDEVKVHVIGFNLSGNGLTGADDIASKGGTGNAVNVDNTAAVEKAFATIFDDTLRTSATRSGLSVVTTPDAATGSFIQPSFRPLVEETNGSTTTIVSWAGELKSYFIDRFGNFREDSNGNAELDANDKGFQILFLEQTNQTYVRRFNVGTDGTESNVEGEPNATNTAIPNLISVDDLKPIFSASDQLNKIDNSFGATEGSRPYNQTTSGTGKRFIKTWIDINANGQFDSNEVKDFNWNTSGNLSQIVQAEKAVFDLPAGSPNSVFSEFVRFIRGQEGLSGYRNRTLNSTTKLLLGDIVHSTPVQVDGPISPNVSGNDYAASYDDFREQYKDRRKMIYVGANGGMLHAFNGGFWTVDSIAGTASISRSPSGSGAVSHELGDEMWAFIPNAVLPQLRFLADPNYSADKHISYVDGSLQVFDAKIFPESSAKYPNGWGTILVAGLRFGGADYQIDYNGDGDKDDANETFRSSYLIFDVTDPEEEPILLDEVTHPDLKLTTSKPALFRTATNQSDERQHTLVFGSGPDDLEKAIRTDGSKAAIFTYDLNNLGQGLQKIEANNAAANSFTGDLRSVDWDQDDIDDAIYFGTVSGTAEDPRGKLFRVAKVGNNLDIDMMINLSRPIQHEPVPQGNQASEADKYIVLGTGRTYTITDTDLVYNRRNILFGLKESFTSTLGTTPVTFEQGRLARLNDPTILNVTGADSDARDDGDDIINSKTRAEILADFRAGTFEGWRLTLPKNNSRLSARGSVIEELAFLTDFQPEDPTIENSSQCSLVGGGFLNVIDIRTGLFPPSSRLRDNSSDSPDSEDVFINRKASSSLLAAGEIIVVGENADGSKRFKFKAPGTNQEITELDFDLIPRVNVVLPGRKSWREIPLQ